MTSKTITLSIVIILAVAFLGFFLLKGDDNPVHVTQPAITSQDVAEPGSVVHDVSET